MMETLAAEISYASDIPKPVCEFLAYQALSAMWAGRVRDGAS
ncbi:hypothetical protein SAMN05216489_00392 [Streptomyces sp. 3213]|nr:hypothetical protein SAMN05216489_00392 [Streptomyces sp. 3213] [Streptomyces sp. 3213.3]